MVKGKLFGDEKSEKFDVYIYIENCRVKFADELPWGCSESAMGWTPGWGWLALEHPPSPSLGKMEMDIQFLNWQNYAFMFYGSCVAPPPSAHLWISPLSTCLM